MTQLLHHDTDLLRQLDAAHRPRVHDDRGRHPHAPSQAARRRDVLPHRDRTSTPPRSTGWPRSRGSTRRSTSTEIAESWKELPRLVDADYDFFIRTTDEGHKRFVQDFIQRIYDNGDIYQDVYAGLYCVGCEASRPKRSSSTASAPNTGSSPSGSRRRTTSSALSAFQQRLLDLYDERPTSCCRASVTTRRARSSTGGLQDFCLSRAGQPWGIPVPWDESQVVYVWVDALINYLSALTYAREGEDLGTKFWPEVQASCSRRTSSASTACSGRRCCLAAGYDVPKQLFVHGWLLARRAEDLEVRRERHRPARPRRRLRQRCGALLGRACRVVRSGRQRHARQPSRAVRA